MGWFFSNLHILRSAEYNTASIPSLVTEVLCTQGFRRASDPDEADLSVSIYDTGGKWISICSDGLSFYTDEAIRTICSPLSERLSTDILTVSCFDSDCLLLCRINKKLDIVSWTKIGSYPGLKVRPTPAKWKDLVSDVSLWKSVWEQKYVFAEEALESIEPLLGLESNQGRFCSEPATELPAERVQNLYFTLHNATSQSEPPRCEITRGTLMPCEIGKDTIITAVNKGGRSKGLAIAFSGNYVEDDEIRFQDVELEYGFDRYPRPSVRLQLEKRQTLTGQWVYWAEIPSFELREAVKEGLPPQKESDEEYKREFGVRFTPEGNSRKLLDITVHFIPLNNPHGQCGWCVWWYSGSKRAFIEEHNRRWNAFFRSHPPGSSSDKLLNIDDYDMDE